MHNSLYNANICSFNRKMFNIFTNNFFLWYLRSCHEFYLFNILCVWAAILVYKAFYLFKTLFSEGKPVSRKLLLPQALEQIIHTILITKNYIKIKKF